MGVAFCLKKKYFLFIKQARLKQEWFANISQISVPKYDLNKFYFFILVNFPNNVWVERFDRKDKFLL